MNSRYNYPDGISTADIDKHFAELGEHEFTCAGCGWTHDTVEGIRTDQGDWLCDACYYELEVEDE